MDSGISGSNESFIVFLFAIVSFICIILYVPWILSMLLFFYHYFTADQASHRKGKFEHPLKRFVETVAFVPKVLWKLLKEPGILMTCIKLFSDDKRFFLGSLLPKFLKTITKPKILLVSLWIVLLTCVTYSTLSFDAHAILGIPKAASLAEIKKAYRHLSRIYHPDINGSLEARQMLAQVRRAHKALVDKEAFEEEEAKSGHFSVGIALPGFLTSQKHDGLVLFGLLALLLLIPWLAYRYVKKTKNIQQLIKNISVDPERSALFLRKLGIPTDPRFEAKLETQRVILRVIRDLGLRVDIISVTTLFSLPLLPDFIRMSMDSVKFSDNLLKMGFSSNIAVELHNYLNTKGPGLIDDFIANYPSKQLDPKYSDFVKVSPNVYKTIMFLFSIHLQEMNDAIEEIYQSIHYPAPSLRRLKNAHLEVIELLRLSYESEKPPKVHIQKLIDFPSRIAKAVSEISPDIQVLLKRISNYNTTRKVSNS